MNTSVLQTEKLDNESKLLDLMPLELWRMVDDFADAKSHTLLRASCSFFRTWLPWEIDVEFEEYKRLFVEDKAGRADGNKIFQSAVHLNPRTMKQEHYDYLCSNHFYFEVFRICILALQEPFSCAQIDLSTNKNFAIIHASRYCRFDVVQLLLQAPRVDPAAQESYAIRCAAQEGHLDVVQLLLQDPRVDPASQVDCAIRWASKYGHLDVVHLLLEDPRVDPAAKENYAIKWASRSGRLDVVQLLLQDARVNPAANDNCAIMWASQNGHLEVVQLLLHDLRVDPSGGDNGAIRLASQDGHLDVVQILLQDPRVNPAADDNYALRKAAIATSNSKEVCDFLLSDPRVVAAYLLNPFNLPSGVQFPTDA